MAELTEEEQSSLLIPDSSSVLRPLCDLYYDDLGPHSHRPQLPADKFKVHDALRAELVPGIGLQTLTSLNLGIYDTDDEDMQEDLWNRISGILRQYSIDQTFNEFLANAADAGADQYHIMLDKKFGGTDHILSPMMAQFQESSSVVLYNNGEFKDRDWHGVLRVGIGGKAEGEVKIGRYGLGGSGGFHFTEVGFFLSTMNICSLYYRYA